MALIMLVWLYCATVPKLINNYKIDIGFGLSIGDVLIDGVMRHQSKSSIIRMNKYQM